MRQLFQSPSSTGSAELVRLIELLDRHVEPSIEAGLPRVPGIAAGRYEPYLASATLPADEQPPDAVFREIAPLFRGAMRWHHPGALININPPPLLPAAAAMAYATQFNPNLAMDVPSGGLALAELEVVKHVATLAGWDWRRAHGLFTFGGKGTNLYAAKVGLHRACPDAARDGVRGEVLVVSTSQGHPCHVEVCDWLGLGKASCLRLPVDAAGRLDLVEAKRAVSTRLARGARVACFIANGGTTLHNTVDPIAGIAALRDELVAEFGLDYRPHLHVDAVIGWAWLFFKGYDFNQNPLAIAPGALAKIERTARQISEVDAADSLGVDFHKTGFCPYISSLFVVRERERLECLGTSPPVPLGDLEFGNYAPFVYSLESSRAATGPLAALVALRSLGVDGFRRLIGRLMSAAERTRQEVQSAPGLCTANPDANGFATLFVVLPPDVCLDYPDLLGAPSGLVARVAEYNYRFYLYMLERQLGGFPIAIDYIGGYEQADCGESVGVLKLFPMSPAYDEAYAAATVQALTETKADFDRLGSTFVPQCVPYRPKPFVTR